MLDVKGFLESVQKTRLEAQKQIEEEIEAERGCVLEPCPECGSKDVLFIHGVGWHNMYTYEQDRKHRHSAVCKSCNLHLTLRNSFFKTEDSHNDIQTLIASWNRAIDIYKSKGENVDDT